MLSIYVRHTKACLPDLLKKRLSPEKIRVYRHCECPKWYSGTHDGVTHSRTSLNANSWEAAERALDKIKVLGAPEPGIPSLEKAVEKWFQEVKLSKLAPNTEIKYEAFRLKLLEFCQRHKVRTLPQFDVLAINEWRIEWQKEQTNHRPEPGIKRNTENSRIATLKLFFGFVRRMRWIPENPMDLIRRQKKGKQDAEEATMPLDEEGDQNYRQLLMAIPQLFAGELTTHSRKRRSLMGTRPEHLVALVELMYETGLRVSDAISFRLDDVKVDSRDGWGVYTTAQVKNHRDVTIAIPPELLSRIQALPRISPRYVFWDGGTDLKTYNACHVWLHLKRAGEAVGLPGVHPHRLRDSFAVNRLNEGMAMQDVSKLLGHSSIEITEKYYAPFVKSRKDALIAKRKALAGTGPVPTPAKVTPIRKRA